MNKLRKIIDSSCFGYLLMFIFGCFIACGLPPISQYWICIIGFLLTFNKMQKITDKRSAVFYMIFLFTGYFLVSSFWLMIPFLNSEKFVAKLMLPVGFGGILFASTIYSLPFFFLPIFKKNISKIFAFSALFAISEWIRSFIFVGFGYNMLGTMWYNNGVISQLASIFGVYGLTFLTVLCFIYPYLFISERKNWIKLILPTVFLIVFVIFLSCWGFSRLYFADESFFNDKKIRIVQPSINTVYDYVPSIIYRNTEDIKSLIKIKNINDVSAVFLHETAFRGYISNQEKYVIQNLIGDTIPDGGYLISGMPRMEYGWNLDRSSFDKRFFNSVTVIDSNFDLSGKYFKKRLVPFGEYIPYIFKLFLPNVLTSSSGFDFPNTQDEQLIKLKDLPALSFSICNEDGHAGQLIKSNLKKDVAAIVNVANISWFGNNNIAAVQNYAYAIMRAIEEGVPNIRVVNRGISGVISPYGKLIDGDVVIVDKNDYQSVLFRGIRNKIMPDEAGIIDVKIPNKIHRTFYNITGNYFIILFLFIFLICIYFFDKIDNNTDGLKKLSKKSITQKIYMIYENILKLIKTKMFLYSILSLLFGSLFVLSMPPFNLFFISAISVIGLYILFEYNKDNLQSLVLILFLFFYSYLFFGSSWITGPMRLSGVDNAFGRYADFFHIIIPSFLFIFSSFLFPVIAKLRNNFLRFIGFNFAFVIGEWVRSQSYMLTGFPFLYIGSIWVDIKPILQFVSLFGIYGLSFVTVLIFSSIAVIFLKYKYKLYYVMSSFLIFISIFCWGYYRIQNNEYYDNLKLRLVQPLKDRHLDITSPEEYEKNFDLVVDVASNNLSKDINLIIFPEVAFPYNLASDSIDSIKYKDRVKKLQNIINNGVYFITGFIGKYFVGNIFGDSKNIDIKRYNMIGLFDNKMNMLSSYKKVHLVPLGEYVPNYLSVLFPRKITAGSSDLNMGDVRNVMYNENHKHIPPFVSNLCYEEVYSSNITDKNLMKNNYIAWMLNLTDDVWFRDTSYPYHHFVASILRAVEEGFTYVRVANDGPSAVIDRYGRLVNGDASIMKVENNKVILLNTEKSNMLKYYQIGVFDVKLPITKGNRTLYSKTGDYLIRNILIFGLLIIIVIDFVLYKKYKTYFIFLRKLKNGFRELIKNLINCKK